MLYHVLCLPACLPIYLSVSVCLLCCNVYVVPCLSVCLLCFFLKVFLSLSDELCHYSPRSIIHLCRCLGYFMFFSLGSLCFFLFMFFVYVALMLNSTILYSHTLTHTHTRTLAQARAHIHTHVFVIVYRKTYEMTPKRLGK